MRRDDAGYVTVEHAVGFAAVTLVIGVLALMGAAAVQALYFGGLPAWAYPGWMARRYYASHPGARERELGACAVI